MSTEEVVEKKTEQSAEQEGTRPAPFSNSEIFRHYVVLTETSLTLSKLLLLFTFFLTVFLSWLAGAEPVWIAARGAITTLGMGLTLWVVNYFFTLRVMETVMADVKKADEQTEATAAAANTVEKVA